MEKTPDGQWIRQAHQLQEAVSQVKEKQAARTTENFGDYQFISDLSFARVGPLTRSLLAPKT